MRMALTISLQFRKMSNVTVLIEKYGIGHAVAAVEKGIVIDFLIDPLTEADASIVGSIVAAKFDRHLIGINGTFVTLPNNKKGFLRGVNNKQVHFVAPVYVDTYTEIHKKQPVSTRLILKGRYVILTPNRPGLSISRRIKSQIIRDNLCDIVSRVSGNLPTSCGLIVRSQAKFANESDLVFEIKEKIHQYSLIFDTDFYEPKIIIDPPKARDRAIVDWFFDEPYSLVEEDLCFDRFGVWEQIAKFMLQKVELKNGGFLIIEPTSAFVAVDINTGSDVSYTTALQTNLFAMEELPRQLAIRGLGGKIVVEFAPLSKKDRFRVEAQFKKAKTKARIECDIVGWTKLGNLELQKKRDKLPINQVLEKDQRFKASN